MLTLLITVSPVKPEEPENQIVTVKTEPLISLLPILKNVQSVPIVMLNVKNVLELPVTVLNVKLHSSTEMILMLSTVCVHLTNTNIVIPNVENVNGNVLNVLVLLMVVTHVEVTEPTV